MSNPGAVGGATGGMDDSQQQYLHLTSTSTSTLLQSNTMFDDLTASSSGAGGVPSPIHAQKSAENSQSRGSKWKYVFNCKTRRLDNF